MNVKTKSRLIIVTVVILSAILFLVRQQLILGQLRWMDWLSGVLITVVLLPVCLLFQKWLYTE